MTTIQQPPFLIYFSKFYSMYDNNNMYQLLNFHISYFCIYPINVTLDISIPQKSDNW